MIQFNFTLTDSEAELLANIIQTDIANTMSARMEAMVDGVSTDWYDANIALVRKIKTIICSSTTNLPD